MFVAAFHRRKEVSIVINVFQACTTPPKPKDTSNGTGAVEQIVNGTGPKVPSSTLAVPSNLAGNAGNAPISGQLLTLPSSVLSKVNSLQPLQLKVNGQKIVIPPNCFIPTSDGVKVFLPANTLPPSVVNSENKAANVKLSVNKEQGEQSVDVLCGSNGKSGGPTNAYVVPECLLPKDDTCYFEKLQVGVDIILNILRFLPHSDLLRYVSSDNHKCKRFALQKRKVTRSCLECRLHCRPKYIVPCCM